MNDRELETNAILRSIRPVNEWLVHPGISAEAASFGHERSVRTLREILSDLRDRIRLGERPEIDPFVMTEFRERVRRAEGRGLRRVVNATGILLHTGLGRAPLSEDAVEAIRQTALGYCDLEFDLESGQRGRRIDAVRESLISLTGAESATVVNNNAAATILALRATASGREVIVSRGQLVEIGGGFRLPEIMAVSGAKLREVGTTNRTRASDYEAAMGPETAAILKVHTSNYAIIGFTHETIAGELARIAHSHGSIFIDDIGSGALTPDSLPSGRHEPTAAESLAVGADLVLFSGDKLLGGPQCGIILGSKACVGRIEADPLMRAFRVDKLTLAALGATLQAWTDLKSRNRRIPFWRMLTESIEDLDRSAHELASELAKLGWNASVRISEAFAGGGSLPSEKIESRAVAIEPPWPEGLSGVDDLAQRLRQSDPAVVGRIHDGGHWLDLRTISKDEHAIVIRAMKTAMGRDGQYGDIRPH